MASGDDPRDADYQQASSQLSDGLKTCRAVVENYRAMMTGEIALPANDIDGFDAGPELSPDKDAQRA